MKGQHLLICLLGRHLLALRYPSPPVKVIWGSGVQPRKAVLR